MASAAAPDVDRLEAGRALVIEVAAVLGAGDTTGSRQVLRQAPPSARPSSVSSPARQAGQ
jgi:hypothetical protein